ncbi:uncharacterized protein N7459_003465 [Penicillium hispanicum]|uniref:uncharacterized protein n=1 Tax=Penicillium hispanicum TaxID=1080232 RepID=UPI0025408124|nr:uncharacterized protein N7459_003465 [Penicillium hispanicum]KAJ5587700.1 hypothetical protein N7459_003465 [Penicillium hispanicum]
MSEKAPSGDEARGGGRIVLCEPDLETTTLSVPGQTRRKDLLVLTLMWREQFNGVASPSRRPMTTVDEPPFLEVVSSGMERETDSVQDEVEDEDEDEGEDE